MSIEIRDMTIDDLDQVMEVELDAFTTPWSRDSFKMEIEKNKLAKYIVALLDGKVVGYGGFWLIVGESHITNVAVHSSCRGRGIGNRLVEGLIEKSIELSSYAITLEVRKSNLIAQGLYKKYGFEEAGIRPNYYTDVKEDAVIMWKNMDL